MDSAHSPNQFMFLLFLRKYISASFHYFNMQPLKDHKSKEIF